MPDVKVRQRNKASDSQISDAIIIMCTKYTFEVYHMYPITSCVARNIPAPINFHQNVQVSSTTPARTDTTVPHGEYTLVNV